MKVVILAGGFGTRISEESATIPKPLVEIGGRPILWHIMKIYSSYGFNEFVICCGYKGDLIKDYFFNYFRRSSDFTIDLRMNSVQVHRSDSEPWLVTLVDTGLNTMTGGRIRRIKDYVGGQTFFLTYGDGVSDVDIQALLHFHQQQAALATVTAVIQPGRFGALDLSSDRSRVSGFREKSLTDGNYINGGFFVLEPAVIDLIQDDATIFEEAPLKRLVESDQLAVYKHEGFWQNMDTLRDKHVLEQMWGSASVPWKTWDPPTPSQPAQRS